MTADVIRFPSAPGRGRRFTDEEAADIARRYAAGEKVLAIAARHGTTDDVVIDVARRAGLRLRGRRRLSDAAVARALSQYAAGVPMAAIRAEGGPTRSHLQRLVKRAGLPARPRGSPPGGRRRPRTAGLIHLARAPEAIQAEIAAWKARGVTAGCVFRAVTGRAGTRITWPLVAAILMARTGWAADGGGAAGLSLPDTTKAAA